MAFNKPNLAHAAPVVNVGTVEYRDIPGSPGYRVGSDGSVWSDASNWRGYGQRELTQSENFHGYLRVRVTTSTNTRRVALVHKLVAEAFLGPRPSVLHQIRHLDGNKLNNRAANLAWGTAKENARDRELHGRTARGSRNGSCVHPERLARGEKNGTHTHPESVARGERQASSKLTEADVRAIRRMHATGTAIKEIAFTFSVTIQNIHLIVHRKAWSHVS